MKKWLKKVFFNMSNKTITKENLKKKHGTPDEFKKAVMKACPDMITIDEANNAIDKYNDEWRRAIW